jgi:hypothetical protein
MSLSEIEIILKETGFEICLFPPDNDPCECCGDDNKQLYFQGPTDSGRYYCLDCVKTEHEKNLEWGRQLCNIKDTFPTSGTAAVDH